MFGEIFGNNYAKAIGLLKKNRLEEARRVLLKILSEKPEFPDVYIELAKISFKTGETPSTKYYLKKYIQLDGTDEAKRSVLEITNWKMVSSLVYFNHTPVFSKDGRRLAYASARADTNGDGLIDNQDRPGIYVYDIGSGREYEIVDNRFYNSSPNFSSDGGHLLYLSARRASVAGMEVGYSDQQDLYICDLKNGNERKLRVEGKIKYPAFSDDGQKIIYSCWKPGENASRVFYYDLSADREFPVTTGVFESTFPSLSPDSTSVLYSSWRSGSFTSVLNFSTIVMADLDTLKEDVLVKSGGDNSFPSFSPDGSLIVYLSRRRDTNGDGKINSLDNANICLFDIKNRHESVLVSDRFFNKYPCFSFHGKNVVFISSWRKFEINEPSRQEYFERKGVYAVSVESKKSENIVSEKYYGCKAPVCSKSDTKVAYLSWRRDTGRGIFLADHSDLPSVDELDKYIEFNLL